MWTGQTECSGRATRIDLELDCFVEPLDQHARGPVAVQGTSGFLESWIELNRPCFGAAMTKSRPCRHSSAGSAGVDTESRVLCERDEVIAGTERPPRQNEARVSRKLWIQWMGAVSSLMWGNLLMPPEIRPQQNGNGPTARREGQRAFIGLLLTGGAGGQGTSSASWSSIDTGMYLGFDKYLVLAGTAKIYHLWKSFLCGKTLTCRPGNFPLHQLRSLATSHSPTPETLQRRLLAAASPRAGVATALAVHHPFSALTSFRAVSEPCPDFSDQQLAGPPRRESPSRLPQRPRSPSPSGPWPRPSSTAPSRAGGMPRPPPAPRNTQSEMRSTRLWPRSSRAIQKSLSSARRLPSTMAHTRLQRACWTASATSASLTRPLLRAASAAWLSALP